jgi:hypothetical protein
MEQNIIFEICGEEYKLPFIPRVGDRIYLNSIRVPKYDDKEVFNEEFLKDLEDSYFVVKELIIYGTENNGFRIRLEGNFENILFKYT